MVADIGVKVEGLDELRRSLRKAGSTVGKDIGKVGKYAADIVAAEARGYVPARTGRARRSVRATVHRGGGAVKGGGANAPYYPFLEFGNKVRSGGGVGRGDSVPRAFIAGGRYLYPALARKRDEVVETYAREVHDALKKADLI